MEHACRRRSVVRLSRVLLIAAVAMVLGLVPATVVRASTNLLSNPGFESPLGGTQTEGTANPSFGNWTAYNFRPSIPMPAEVGAPDPVHSGQASGEVRDPPGIGSAFFYQDLSSFDPNSTYTISAWVYPESGEQGFDLEFGWDRGSQGNTTGSSSFSISPSATGSSAWGQSVSAPPVTYNTWHHIQLVVNGTIFTSELYIDGVYEGTSSAGQPVPSGSNTTLLIGYGSVPPSENRFFWDDLEITPGITVGSPSGLVGEWKGDGNANDTVGTSNGTLVDGDYAPGRSGQAFNLDGIDDYVSIPSTAMANVTGAISVSAWVNPISLPTTEGAVILSQYDTHDTETAFDIELMPGGHIEWQVTGAGCDSLHGDTRVVESTSSIIAGQWTQVTGTYDPTTEQLQILINGQPVATQLIESASVPSLCRSNTPLRIGAAESIGGPLGDFFDGEIEDIQLYNTDISPTGGASSAPPSCAAMSSAATLANLSAEICRLVNDESAIVQQEGVLLGVVGTFPHVSPTGVNTYTGAAIATVPGSEAATTQAAMHLMEEALYDFSQEVADAVVDKIADAYPDTVQAVHDLGSAEEEDVNAATEQLKAAKAIVDSLGGLTAISLTEIAYHTASATLHLLKKLEAFQKALEKFRAELVNNSQAPTQEQIELEAILGEYIKSVSGDIIAVTSAMSQIALVPQGGYDVFPGLPVTEFYPGSGATVVVDQSQFTNGVLTPGLNPIGLSSGAVVNFPTVPSPTVSSGTVNAGGTLVVSGTGLGASTSVEAGLGSVTSLGSGIGALPSVPFGGSSFRAFLASVPAVLAASSAPMRLAVFKTNSKGRFSTRLQIPANAAPGEHELYVIGVAPNGTPRLLEISITVTAPPILRNLTQSRRRWREGSKLARSTRKSRLSIGTVFSFTLNEPAKMSFAFTQPSGGRRVKGRCVGRSPENRRKPNCKWATTRGVLSFTGHAGLNKVSFQGRISHRQKLKPGSYTLMLTATGTYGRSAPKTLSFTIVK
jgi:Concanavalin A-like lectin/glucanases superfamily